MTDESQNVAEEIAAEEVVQPQESVDQSQEHPPETQQEEVDSSKEYNFKELRESKKQLERELQELRDHVSQLSQPKAEEAPQEYEIGDDDLVEGRHVKQYFQKIQNYLQQKEQETIPDRLRSKFSDFDEVVSKENVEKLRKAEPEIYSSIVSGQDLYAKGVSAYKTLKALGIGGDTYKQEKEHVQKTHAKPMSTQAVKGQGALAEANAFANGLTPALKEQLRKEMEEAARAC
jgi:hypothetical protein